MKLEQVKLNLVHTMEYVGYFGHVFCITILLYIALLPTLPVLRLNHIECCVNDTPGGAIVSVCTSAVVSLVSHCCLEPGQTIGRVAGGSS